MTQQGIALVIGAARGIGLATVTRLVKAGNLVAMVGVDAETLQGAAATPPAHQVLAVPLDISQGNALVRLDAVIKDRWGAVSILVNNAAVSPKHTGRSAGLAELSAEEWEFVMRVNVTTLTQLARLFAPRMQEQGWGRIINISSRAGRTNPYQASAASAASKAALLGVTRAVATEFGTDGVTANSVAPGLVETTLVSGMNPETIAQIRSRTPVGRSGTPEKLRQSLALLRQMRRHT